MYVLSEAAGCLYKLRSKYNAAIYLWESHHFLASAIGLGQISVLGCIDWLMEGICSTYSLGSSSSRRITDTLTWLIKQLESTLFPATDSCEWVEPTEALNCMVCAELWNHRAYFSICVNAHM